MDLSAARYRDALRDALRGETKAYGFALVVWATGELVGEGHGPPQASGVIAFVGGILAAMAAVLIGAFGGPARTEHRAAQQHFGFGGVHIVAVPVAIGVGWALEVAIAAHWEAYLAAEVLLTSQR